MTRTADASPARAAKREAYRRVILECAERLFAESGVDGTRVEAIAAAAGVAPRTLYSVFSAKEEIVQALAEGRRTTLLEVARRAAEGAASPFDGMRSSAVAAARFFIENPDYLRLELAESRAWADERSSRSVTWHMAVDAFAQVFDRCMEDGTVRVGDPKAFAHALIAIMQSHDRVLVEIDDLVVHAFGRDLQLPDEEQP
jgi:AcrR family transcriptional regulator